MTQWWMDSQYDRAPMFYPEPTNGPARRVPLTTDPAWVKNDVGGQTFTLINRHPHEALRIFAPRALRC